jgi:anti-sigma factor RsiW
MDHTEAIQLMIAEKYLLDELPQESREQFEEHYFGCPECALDVRAGAAFVDQMKLALAEAPSANQVRVPIPARRPAWMGWLRPALVLPVLAVLVVVIGYQNFVTYPRLELAANAPQVLPWASVNLNSRGTNAPIITARPGQGFLLFVNIPPDSRYSSYVAELHDQTGKMEWSLTIPAVPAQDVWPIRVPSADRQSGTYTLVVQGIDSAGARSEVGRSSFELHIQE